MRDLEDDGLEYGTSEIVNALNDVESAVGRVEEAIHGRSTFWSVLIFLAFAYWVPSLIDDAWHSKWRYALAYGVSSDKVQIYTHAHDCAFLAVPLGEKYCHYERVVSTTRWGRSVGSGHPIISTDDGKTWTEFTPDANVSVPQYSTVEEVYVGWEKKDDE